MTWKNCRWVLDNYFIERAKHYGYCRLDLACEQLGITYVTGDTISDPIPVKWIARDLDSKMQLPLVTHGTKQFVRKILTESSGLFIPGAYAQSDKFSYSGFSSYYSKYMLNDRYILLPFGELFSRKDQIFSIFKDEVFIRPDKTSKEFTGNSFTKDDYYFELNSLKQLANPNLDSICVVAQSKPIQSEFRFVIADHTVVTGSEYRWDNVLDVRSDVLSEAQELAETIAQLEWQPDRVWVCDIAMHEGEAYLLEINPFSSSSMYACNAEKIIEEVSKAAWKEYAGEDE